MDTGSRVSKAIELIAQLSIDRASQVLSKLVKSGAKITLEKAYMTTVAEATAKVNAEEGEVMGALIDLMGSAPFKFLFYTSVESSRLMTELILQRKAASIDNFDLYVHSAVQEVGNILSSAVCNVFASDFNIAIKPSPPTVIHDFAGTVFQECILDTVSEEDDILIIESQFCIVRRNIYCNMFILPMPGSEKTLNYIFNSQFKGD